MTAETGQTGPASPIDLIGEPDFALGASQVSPSKREVARAGLHEMLEPRIMQVLVALYRADGRVVSRDELIARCWEGRIVGEDAINRAIGRLRRLSEADGGLSFVIETIPKIGFRLVASQPLAAAEKVLSRDAELLSTVHGLDYRLAATPEISSTEPGSGPPPEAIHVAAPRRWAMRIALTAVCVVTLAAAGLWLVQGRLPLAPKPTSCDRRSGKTCRDIGRGAAVPQPVLGQGPGILLRRHDRGDHLGAGQGAGPDGDRAHLGLPVQRREQGYARHRPGAGREQPHRRLGAQSRQPGPHHRPAHQGRRRHAALDRKL